MSPLSFFAVTTYFYPRPPRGGRQGTPTAVPPLLSLFLSTPSARRATGTRSPFSSSITFLSTPSARRATDQGDHRVDRCLISIHALREEGDRQRSAGPFRPAYFYPRPPRGGRHLVPKTSNSASRFLSTPSARRATLAPFAALASVFYFYPRPPRGGRRKSWAALSCASLFLSTPSARRATPVSPKWDVPGKISIHALREEGDN